MGKSVTIRGLRPCPTVTYPDLAPDEARRAYHDQFPGWAGVILEVIENEEDEADE